MDIARPDHARKRCRRRILYGIAVVLTLALDSSQGYHLQSDHTRILARLLFEVKPSDPPTFIAVPLALAIENPDEWFAIRHKNPKGELSDYGLDYWKFRELRAHSCQSAELIAFGYLYLKWTGNDREREVHGEIVSGNYFSTLGIPAVA